MTRYIDRTVNPDRQQHHTKIAEDSDQDPRGDRVGMTAAQRYHLEKTALERLNRLDPNHWNTPELIRADDHTLTLTLRWAGWNLRECEQKGIRPQFGDLDRDCQLITDCLDRAEILLLDRHRENLLWNPETGRLVITDFDSIWLRDSEPTALQQRYRQQANEPLVNWLKTTATRS